MRVNCVSKNCMNRGGDGRCTFDEIMIEDSGVCGGFVKGLGYEPVRADNVVVFDNAGLPSIMVRFSRMTNKELFGGSDKVNPMFVIGGEVYDEIYISKYPNVIINGKAYSLPMQQPAVNVTQEEAENACFSKGEGWHLMTAVERGFLANLSLREGTLPHGNTNYGKYHADESETGECFDGYKTLTGSGPATWSHDHTVFGVHDLCGNVWERIRGMRLMDGVLQVAENNDAAMEVDLSAKGTAWKNVMYGGKPVRFDCTDGVRITTEEDIDEDYTGDSWEDVSFDFGVIEFLKELALYDGEPSAYVYADTEGERLPICGGGWYNGAGAGVFSVSLYNPRSDSGGYVGFRSAFYRKL